MAWTHIPDSSLEPGKPIRSVDGLALRDNPIAIANGDPGAPRIQNPAYETDSIDFTKLMGGAATRFGSVPFNLTFGSSSGTSVAEVTIDTPGQFGGVAFAQWVVTGPAVSDDWVRIYGNGNVLVEGTYGGNNQLWTVFHTNPGVNSYRVEFERPGGGTLTATGSFLVCCPIR